jgi:hypothetical protein
MCDEGERELRKKHGKTGQVCKGKSNSINYICILTSKERVQEIKKCKRD